MKRHTKLSSQEQEQQTAARQAQEQSVREFTSVEDLLRHDATHTVVPPSIEARLRRSTSDLPPPRGLSWWRRLFNP